MKKHNPFRDLSKFELSLWLLSITIVTVSYLLTPAKDYLSLTASLIGVTALIFVSKGYVLGQVLTVVFAVFYGIISFYFKCTSAVVKHFVDKCSNRIRNQHELYSFRFYTSIIKTKSNKVKVKISQKKSEINIFDLLISHFRAFLSFFSIFRVLWVIDYCNAC